MKRYLSALGVAVLAIVASVLLYVQPANAAVGLHISGANIVEANGQTFTMRGVNHPHVWFTSQTSSFADIKALGANTVRVVLGSGHRGWGTSPASDVANVIGLCKQNRLICVLEVHDTTGYGEQNGAASLDQAADYWIGIKDVLVGEENYVVINIGNEPIGNNDAGQWTSATTAAIQKLRDNGFEHLLMVDAPNWGQDWQYVMRDNAQTILDADNQHNTVLSIHMYSVFNTAASITNYLDQFQANGWPLVIGEFGWRFNNGEVDHDTILAESVARGLGYLGWSWSGNNDPILDMAANFDPNQLTTWGERIFNGANGIEETAQEATIYSCPTCSPSPSPTGSPTASPSPSPSPSPTASPSPSPSDPGGRTCTATYTMLNQWPDGFQGEVRVTAGSQPITSWQVTWTWPDGQSIYQAWNAQVTSNGSSVVATNMSYNGSLDAGQGATWGFLANWDNNTNTNPTPACTAG